MDFNKALKKARREIYKDRFEQILEAVCYKRAAERPPISHLINHQFKTNRDVGHWLEKYGLTRKRYPPVVSNTENGQSSVDQRAKTYIHQFYANIECSQEDCIERWTIVTEGEWESWESMQSVWLWTWWGSWQNKPLNDFFFKYNQLCYQITTI